MLEYGGYLLVEEYAIQAQCLHSATCRVRVAGCVERADEKYDLQVLVAYDGAITLRSAPQFTSSDRKLYREDIPQDVMIALTDMVKKFRALGVSKAEQIYLCGPQQREALEECDLPPVTYLRETGMYALHLQVPEKPDAGALARTATELVERIRWHQDHLDEVKPNHEYATYRSQHHNRMLTRCKELLAELSKL